MKQYKLILLAGTIMLFPQYSSAEADSEKTLQNARFDEIIVTARRKDERLQETPVAITALTASSLEQRSVFNTEEISRLSPGLNIRSGGGSQSQSYIFIRGIGQNSDNPALEPGVGIYVDDVFMPRSQGGLLDFNDIAQVEVLRGPQGTLYGKNTVGGAIKFTSIMPSDERSASVRMGYGRFNEIRASVAINEPLVEDKLFLRVSASLRNSDGTYENAFDGQNTNDKDSLSGRVLLRYMPTPELEFLFSADIYRDRSLESPNRLIALNNDAGALGAIQGQFGSLSPYLHVSGADPRFGGGSDVRSDPDLQFRPFVDLVGTSLTATWTNDNVTVKSITAYRELNSVRILDVDGTPFRILNIGDETTQDQFSQEIQLSGTVFDGAVNYIGGLFYYDENIVNDFRQVLPIFGVFIDDINFIRTTSYAAYFNAGWDVTEKLSITVGGRFTSEKRALARARRDLPDLNVVVPRFGLDEVNKDFSPKIEADYRISDDIFAYVSFSQGFKSGGFNSSAANLSQLFTFDPEKTDSYEAGLKSQFLDRRLTINAAVFYTDYRNLQASVISNQNGQLLQAVTNAGHAKLHGIELEGNFRATDDLTLFGSFGYIGSKYVTFFDAVRGDLSGNKLPNISKYSYLLGADYHKEIGGDKELSLSIDYSWKSAQHLDAFNTPEMRSEPLGLLGARAAVAFPSNFQLAVYGKNLTNDQVVQSGSEALNNLGFAWGAFNAPRTYGVELVWRY